jgi:hypothetical protein
MSEKENLQKQLTDLQKKRSKMFKEKYASPQDLAKKTEKISKDIAELEAQIAAIK